MLNLSFYRRKIRLLANKDIQAAITAIKSASRVVVVQAENPDGDSLGSAIALEEILVEAGKQVDLYCSVDIPRHIRYVSGWERVGKELPQQFDLLIIVDAVAASLLEKLYSGSNLPRLQQVMTLLIDHHSDKTDLPIENPLNLIDTNAVAAGQVVYELVAQAKWKMPQNAADAIAVSILSDSLGLTSAKTTARSIYILAELVEKHGVSLTKLDTARRDLNKKSIAMLNYKAELIQRIEYYLNNRLALIVIPKSEIESYSEQYNPGALVQEELRNVEEVDISIALKDYGDRITARLRASHTYICDAIAEQFGGGGHIFAAGFKTNKWKLEDLKKELVRVTGDLLKKHAEAD